MSRVTKAISDVLLKRVEEALSEVKGGDVSRKLQAIKSASVHGIKKVASVFGINRVALMSWITLFDKDGINSQLPLF
jgi:hypothetical protein